MSHPRILFSIDNGDFKIDINCNDIVPFNEIYNLEINDEPEELELDIEVTLPYDVQTRIKDIVSTKYVSSNDINHELNIADLPSSEIKIELKDTNVFLF